MHALDFLADTYETEQLKTVSTWQAFETGDFEFRPAPRIRTPHEHMVHQCVSEDNWMKNMLGIDTGCAALPQIETQETLIAHYRELSARRLAALREKPEEWFRETAAFFEVQRSRSWIMLRRLTHSAHHRAQLVVYLRLLGRPVYSTYGPSADTGGLPVNKAPTIYRESGIALPGPGEKSPTERPPAFPVRRSLERATILLRGGRREPAWRLTADNATGSGAITLIDDAYRGEGIYSGWTQERLAAEYARLNPAPDEPAFEVPQLG